MIGGWAFRRELHLWRVAGRRLGLWWRDDDARAADPALERLLGLASRHGLPLTLAVIRRETGSWKWMWVTFSYMLALAYIAAFITYRTAVAFGAG